MAELTPEEAKTVLNEIGNILSRLPDKNEKACPCIVKRTEVHGLCIIYPRFDCPYHGHFNNERVELKNWVR